MSRAGMMVGSFDECSGESVAEALIVEGLLQPGPYVL